ncbi:MAG: DUF1223 domain-containing protein [Hyphomicrobiaceae bacterium]
MRPFNHPLALFVICLVGAILPARAEEVVRLIQPKPVIELFTSQGCSSCPAADVLLGEYARRGDVVALSMPVDYWDYLGWKDTLASAKFTARQREYAAHRGDGQIYTPQIVVDGAARVVGSDRATVDKAVTSAVSRCKSSPITIGLSMGRTTMQIALDIGPTAPATELEGTVWVAVVRPEVPVAIQRGENRGKTVIYHNVVRELIPVGLWSGGSARLKLDRSAIMTSPGERSAVIVQQGKGGPIIAGGWFE